MSVADAYRLHHRLFAGKPCREPAAAGTWLRVGGTILVIAHDQSNLTHGYGGPPSAEISYTVERAVAAFGSLDIGMAEVAKRTVDTPAGPKIALDTLVVANRSE